MSRKTSTLVYGRRFLDQRILKLIESCVYYRVKYEAEYPQSPYEVGRNWIESNQTQKLKFQPTSPPSKSNNQLSKKSSTLISKLKKDIILETHGVNRGNCKIVRLGEREEGEVDQMGIWQRRRLLITKLKRIKSRFFT